MGSRFNVFPYAILMAFLLGGCVSASGVKKNREINLSSKTKTLSGVLYTTGEWMIFPSREKYIVEPDVEDGGKKCASVINNTGISRKKFIYFNRKNVEILGYSILYKDIPISKVEYEKLMNRRYYNNEIVLNSCFRDYVFIANKIDIIK